ncbi:hypothetical protein CMO93_02385 [Candidatus Woesearchaeota archaeon]|nr:hypothetical protein [Candidatus Woesearchaeota archaeon]|tara:strand:+ start:551 stop:1048 length:498 start_codon:yes stop_codon:yes gene_type:complete
MAFMKRDVNIGLLILIIASIIVFSGFSVYYQTTFKDVSLEYQSKLEQLGTVTTELATQKQALNETYSLKKKAEQDREVLDVRYKDVRDENEKISTDNTNLRLEITNTKNDLGVAQSDLENKKVQLAQTQADLSDANSRISSLNSKLDEVCSSYTALNGEVEHDRC